MAYICFCVYQSVSRPRFFLIHSAFCFNLYFKHLLASTNQPIRYAEPWLRTCLILPESPQVADKRLESKTNIIQGLVNVPFWEYWTSPYSSHKKDHIPNGWVMWNMGTWLMTHVITNIWRVWTGNFNRIQLLRCTPLSIRLRGVSSASSGAETWQGRPLSH